MPVSHIPSAEAKKANKSSYKRRKDQNSEISELEALLPWSQKGAGIDKISVLRLTSTYIKFKEFWDSIAEDYKAHKKPFPGIERLFSEAIDGFLLILSSSGDVLYVSEGVADYVGVTQQEIIGLPIYELTHCDDHQSIRENLKAKGLKPQQFRQFYIRFKSSISPAKKQLSKFGGTIMLQVSGNLKISKRRHQYMVTGLVAECRRIESSSSILEVSIPQITFTSTTTLDLKIVSLDTKMSRVTGFTGDIKGSLLTDFFHPSDNRRSIHCLKLLLITGQADSPIIRFMTHTGEWVWVQIQGVLRYEKDNKTPKYLEASFKLICASGDSLTMIEQKELYAKVEDGDENVGIHADTRFNVPGKPTISSPEDIVKGIEDARVSPAVRDVILHGREEALRSIPMNMDRLAKWEEVVEAVVEYEVSNGLPPNYEAPYPPPPVSIQSLPSMSSPLSSLSPATNSSSPCSSVPLSHPTTDVSPYSSPEPIADSRTTPTKIPTPDVLAGLDVYVPSESGNTMLGTLTDPMMIQPPNPTPPLSMPHGPPQSPEPILSKGGGQCNLSLGPPDQNGPYSGNLQHPFNGPDLTATKMATQNGNKICSGPPNMIPSQYNAHGSIATQYNGPNAVAMQCNGPSTIATQYNSPNTMAHQYNEPNTLATQHNAPYTNATQYNNMGVIATQYNSGEGCVGTQYNSHDMRASQVNSNNGYGAQYNGPGVAATQFNSSNGMNSGMQCNAAMSQAYQYNNASQSDIPSPYSNGGMGNMPVSVVANQFIGVQPNQYDNTIPPSFNNPHHLSKTGMGTPPTPVINMNVTINLPPNGIDQKPVPAKLSHLPANPTQYPPPSSHQPAPLTHHVGKMESMPMDAAHNPGAQIPYNVQGTFEVSQNWSSTCARENGWKMNSEADDILEALQLM